MIVDAIKSMSPFMKERTAQAPVETIAMASPRPRRDPYGRILIYAGKGTFSRDIILDFARVTVSTPVNMAARQLVDFSSYYVVTVNGFAIRIGGAEALPPIEATLTLARLYIPDSGLDLLNATVMISGQLCLFRCADWAVLKYVGSYVITQFKSIDFGDSLPIRTNFETKLKKVERLMMSDEGLVRYVDLEGLTASFSIGKSSSR
jgi:hypothetical protein